MMNRRTLLTQSAAASAAVALLPATSTAAPDSAPLSTLEAIQRHLTSDLDYEITMDVSFELDLREVPPHLASLLEQPAPLGIYRRDRSESGRLGLHGAFNLYGNRWNGESHVRSSPADLLDFHRKNYQQADAILVERDALADEIDLLREFRRLLHID